MNRACGAITGSDRHLGIDWPADAALEARMEFGYGLEASKPTSRESTFVTKQALAAKAPSPGLRAGKAPPASGRSFIEEDCGRKDPEADV